MRVEIDQDRCIGSGQCVLITEEVFDQREEDDRGYVLDAAPPAALEAAVHRAAAGCPGQAITILG